MDLEDAYDRHAARVYRHALAITGHAADAEDVLQNVFAKLATRAAWWIPVRDAGAYLHVAARREALRLRGRRPPDVPLAEDADPVDPRSAAPRSAADRDRGPDRDALTRLVARLPVEQREVFLLHAVVGETFERIARLTGTSPNTAASRYRYARDKLKEWVDATATG